MSHQYRRTPSALGIPPDAYYNNGNAYSGQQQGYYPYEGGPPSMGSQMSEYSYPTFSPANSLTSTQSYNDSPYAGAPRYSHSSGYADPALMGASYAEPALPFSNSPRPGSPRASYAQAVHPPPRPPGANRSPYGSTYDLRGASADAWDTHSVNSHQSYSSAAVSEAPPQLLSALYAAPYGPGPLPGPLPEPGYGAPYDPYAPALSSAGSVASLPGPPPGPPAAYPLHFPPAAPPQPFPGLARPGSGTPPPLALYGPDGRPPLSPNPLAGGPGPAPAVRWAAGPAAAGPASRSGSRSGPEHGASRASDEPGRLDADLEEALKRSMDDAAAFRRQQDDTQRALEAANEAALRRALEESVRDQRQPAPPRSALEDADDEALHRALRESAQAGAVRAKSALELADEEALRQAIERSLADSAPPVRIQSVVLASQDALRAERRAAATYENRPLPKVPSAGSQGAMGAALGGRSMVPIRVPSEPNLGV